MWCCRGTIKRTLPTVEASQLSSQNWSLATTAPAPVAVRSAAATAAQTNACTAGGISVTSTTSTSTERQCVGVDQALAVSMLGSTGVGIPDATMGKTGSGTAPSPGFRLTVPKKRGRPPSVSPSPAAAGTPAATASTPATAAIATTTAANPALVCKQPGDAP